MELCIKCRKRPVSNKKRQLCKICYCRLQGKQRRLGKSLFSKEHKYIKTTETKNQHLKEILFIKNYFIHPNWIYQPTTFRLDETTYSPDFYDGETNAFIEVSGSQQAYFQNKDKYRLFKETFPKINFEIRNPDGEIIDENKSINSQI